MTRHREGHGGGGPSTRGHVLHWAFLYDTVFGPLLRRSHPAVVELAGPAEGDRVLDVGCGAGSLTIALGGRVGRSGSVHGVDASPEMIREARRRAARSGSGAAFQVGLAESLPFPDGGFDLVVSQLALHHLPDDLKDRALREMRRVLRKPGGRCLIVEFRPPAGVLGRLACRAVLGSGMATMDPMAWLPLLREAGFEEVEGGPTRHGLLVFLRGRAGAAPPATPGGGAG